MGRSKKWPPAIHTYSGRARVWYSGKWYDLGPANSPESRAEYGRLIALWSVDPTASGKRRGELLVSELCRDYCLSAACPTESRQRGRVMTAITLLVERHAQTAVSEFSPVDLDTWQTWLATIPDKRHGTRYNSTMIGHLVGTVRKIWKWGVRTGRVDVAQLQALQTVGPLRNGIARPPRDVAPADPESVRATIPHLRPQVRAIVLLEWMTGARPSEICTLRRGDILQSGRVRVRGSETLDLDTAGVWVALLRQHKTAWKGKARWLTFGAEAQEVLLPFLDRPPESYLFSPRESVETQREQQRAKRLEAGGGSGGNRKPPAEKPQQIGEHYTPRTFRQAIARACQRAGVEHWFPYQLRHLAAVEVKSAFGIDGVQALLGHHTRSMSEHYGGTSFTLSAAAAKREIG